MEGEFDEDDYIDHTSRRCIEEFYKEIEANSLIEKMVIDMELISNHGFLPTLNLDNAQFKESLMYLMIRSQSPVSTAQSLIISSLLENTSLENFVMSTCKFDDESAFRRIVQACLNVDSLEVKCNTTFQFAAVAALLENAASILNELHLNGNITDQGLSLITAGLIGNTTLKKLSMDYRRGRGIDSIEKLLCDSSTIESICNSNHILNTIYNTRLERMCSRLPLQVSDCLELNKNTNKNAVIHKKIARYYFVGDFDVSPFITMPISLLLKVLVMIEGHALDRQVAIFKLLRVIPELCNVSSRATIGKLTD
eukprot:scaffold333558_cov106-Cyclotella_meneghiniana.AAC.2